MSSRLHRQFRRFVTSALIPAGIAGAFGGCSTTELTPAPAPLITPPEYVRVPHPSGYNLGDLRAIFAGTGSPPVSSLKDCDAPFARLRSLTVSEDEIRQGARELIRQNPVAMHWCFYGKLVELEDYLKAEPYVDARQKSVLKTYAFLVPVARAYVDEYHDSRYLRWAIRHYKNMSEWVFFRRLDISPQMTGELVEAANPFGLVRENAPQKPILEKYGIVKTETAPVAAASPAPGAVSAAAAAAVSPAPGASAAPNPDSPFAALGAYEPAAGADRAPAGVATKPKPEPGSRPADGADVFPAVDGATVPASGVAK